MSQFSHVMIDIETYDNTLHSVIASIAAVKFNFTDANMETFYRNVSPVSGKEAGLTVGKDTLDWWASQPKEARAALMHDQIHLKDALLQLSMFLAPMNKHATYWAQGTVFDFGNLQTALEAFDLKHPWKYYQISDTRTVFKLCKLDFTNYPRVGNHHNALDDCLTQIAALKELFPDD
jgi:hypothetical protein